MVEVKYVVAVLGMSLLASLGGIVWLATAGQPIPDVLQNIAVGSLTALAGVLVPYRGTSGTTTPPDGY